MFVCRRPCGSVLTVSSRVSLSSSCGGDIADLGERGHSRMAEEEWVL